MAKTARTSIQAHKKAQKESIVLSGSIEKFFNYCSFRLHHNFRFEPYRKMVTATLVQRFQ